MLLATGVVPWDWQMTGGLRSASLAPSEAGRRLQQIGLVASL
jgi:hypothetical protein